MCGLISSCAWHSWELGNNWIVFFSGIHNWLWKQTLSPHNSAGAPTKKPWTVTLQSNAKELGKGFFIYIYVSIYILQHWDHCDGSSDACNFTRFLSQERFNDWRKTSEETGFNLNNLSPEKSRRTLRLYITAWPVTMFLTMWYDYLNHGDI